jgi:hypothetical protein
MNGDVGKYRPLMVVGAAAVFILLGCCVCSSMGVMLGFDAVGGVLGAVTRLSRRGEGGANVTLYRALRDGSEATFRLGEGCEVTFAQGNVVSSGLETGGGSGFAVEMSRDEVVEMVNGALREELFRVQDGSISLESGIPVSTSILGEGRVSISFGQQIGTGAGTTNRSLDGVVEGDRFQGSYHLDQNISTVENGQGVERAVTAAANLNCPVQWVGRSKRIPGH